MGLVRELVTLCTVCMLCAVLLVGFHFLLQQVYAISWKNHPHHHQQHDLRVVDVPSIDSHPHPLLLTSLPGIESSYNPTLISSDLKIYIYDLPRRFNIQLRIENPKCDSTMFSAEVAFHNYLLNNKVRTTNPNDADLYFIPVYSTCKWTKWANGPSPWEGRLLVSEAILHVKNNYPYFDRVGGRDHVVMATHDYGQCFDYKKRRTEVKQMGSEEEKAKYTNSGPLQELQNVIVLSTFGSPNSPCYQSDKDITIPAYIPVPPRNATTDGRALKASWKVDMEKAKDGTMGNGVQNLGTTRRDIHVFFLGQLVWRDDTGKVDYQYSFGLRSAIQKWHGKKTAERQQKKVTRQWSWKRAKNLNIVAAEARHTKKTKRWSWKKDPHIDSGGDAGGDADGDAGAGGGGADDGNTVVKKYDFFDVGAVERDGTGGLPRDQYMAKLRRSNFCLAPAGFAPWSRRLYEVMIEGCIPVIIADDIVLPFSAQLRWESFSIRVAEHLVKEGKLFEILSTIPEKRIQRLRTSLLSVREAIMWRFPTPRPISTERPSVFPTVGDNAWSFVIRELGAKAKTWSRVRRSSRLHVPTTTTAGTLK